MPTVAHTIRRRHNRKRQRSRETRRSTFWTLVVVGAPLAVVVTAPLGALALSFWLYLSAASLMPEPQETALPRLEQGETRFLDSTDQTIIHRVADPLDEGRRWLTLDELPPHLVSASMMAEGIDQLDALDPFDPADTLLQVWRYIIGLPVGREDGLSGNLARDTLLPLTRASGLDARLLEIVHVAESKRRFSAEELLEWRLNTNYYGRDAFGIEAAAHVYLGKSALALSLAESALLAPIVAAPSLNPIDAPAQARERGADLLFRMLDAELIDKAQFDAASALDIALRKPDARQAEIAPAFIIYARQQAEDLLDSLGFSGARLMASGALQITTSLDVDLHLQAECAMRAHLRGIDQITAVDGSPCAAASELAEVSAAGSAPPNIGALALIDVDSGRILSMVGDAEAASRQPAIVLQPFVYLEAFLGREFTPASMVYDLPRAYPAASAELIYAPANPDGVHRGPLILRDAMAAGLLPPAVQVASVSGMGSIIDTARAIGFNSLDARGLGLSLLERGGAVSVLDTAYAYSALASMGAMRGLPAGDGFRARDPVAILRIEDASGRVLWSHDDAPPANETLIIQPSAAYMVNDILADADAREASLAERDSDLRISRPAAVVDGISADKRDSWTVGHSPDLALAAHTSRADGAPLGSANVDRAGSAPLWRALMAYAHSHLQLPERYWSAPADIEEYLVCEISGLLPATTAHCPTRKELVPAGTLLQRDHYWRTFEINRADGQLATVNTPDELRESRAYFIPPDDIMDWWLDNGKPLPPSSYSSDSDAESAKPARIISPAEFAYVGARVEIAAIVNRADAESWLLEYGADVNPAAWTSIGERQPLDDSGEIAATWETALFSGIYTLRLSVTFADGSVESDSKLLTFDNTPPAVKLRTGDGITVIRYPSQQVISLLADASDNLTIERVAFYRDDELFSDDRDWPFGVEIDLEEVGDIVFKAIVYDQVGNRASSELAVSVVDG